MISTSCVTKTKVVNSQVCPVVFFDLDEYVKRFEAGQVASCLNIWEKYTSDPEILQIVRGDVITFEGDPPENDLVRSCNVSEDTRVRMNKEINDMLAKKIISKCEHEEGEYLSPIFPVPKPDGSLRIILNLKRMNKSVEYLHFKMDTIKVVLANVTRNCYMSALDLKSAYHSVKIGEDFQKYLRFQWEKDLYQFTCYPNGLGPCPRKFTKLMKVPLSHLRDLGHFIMGYIDDFFLKGQGKEKCRDALYAAIALLKSLGFTVHPGKSQLDPQQIIIFLGFVINSCEMTVALTDEKKVKLKELVISILSKDSVVIRKVASVIGKIVSSLPGSLPGAIYYRNVEKDKDKALKRNKGNYEAKMTLSPQSREELLWWKEHVDTTFAPIHWPPITKEISTDASGKNGWGASMLGHVPIGGVWTKEQEDIHINVKELLAILYALRSFIDSLRGNHVRVLCDNTTAVHTVNKMGTTRSMSCNSVVKEIWEFSLLNEIFLTCTYIPGKENVVADRASRKEYKQGEWMLNKILFEQALAFFEFEPDIDCFATRANAQIKVYASRYPDPYCTHVDAFSFNWRNYKPYLFPPFSIINSVLQKIRVDQTVALCVLPRWKTQAWWPEMLDMMVGKPMVLRASPDMLVLPNQSGDLHPLREKLELVICVLSGRNTELVGTQMLQ